MSQPKEIGPAARVVGRPRSLTLDALLDAAIELGPKDLNMKDLAARLNVGIATIYRYVASRDDLIRLVSARQAYRHVPSDTGLPWYELVFSFAGAIYSGLASGPYLITTYLEGGLGAELEVEFVDAFIGALSSRGFSAEEALDIFRAVGRVAMGAAVAEAHFAALRAAGGDLRTSVMRTLDERDPDELPHVRKVLDAYTREQDAESWRAGVEHVVRNIAARRGEQLPDDLHKPASCNSAAQV